MGPTVLMRLGWLILARLSLFVLFTYVARQEGLAGDFYLSSSTAFQIKIMKLFN